MDSSGFDLSFFFFFCLLIVFIYARTQHDGQTRPTSFRAAQGRDSAQEKKVSRKIQQQARFAFQTSLRCILYLKL